MAHQSNPSFPSYITALDCGLRPSRSAKVLASAGSGGEPRALLRREPPPLPAEAPLGTFTITRASGISSSSDAIDLIAKEDAFQNTRLGRYSLHSAIRRIDPEHRTASCLWCRVSTEKTVQVLLDVEHNRARYNNLRVCGRIWTCPFCSAKISEGRAVELASAMAVAKNKGFRVALLTCTVPHVVQESLKSLMKGLMKAWTGFTSDRVGKGIRAVLGLVGTIRNIEVTHGVNGWHPHFHCLVFYKNDVDLVQIESEWSAHWQHCCVKVGLRRPSVEHGLTLQNGDYAAAYVSKWGLQHELTKSMHKVGRNHGRTPFDIARDSDKGINKEKNGELWREFSAAFHNVRQLFWSANLKKMLAVQEVTDEELALHESERPTRLSCELSGKEWEIVRKKHRATLLRLAEHDPFAMPNFLDRLLSSRR